MLNEDYADFLPTSEGKSELAPIETNNLFSDSSVCSFEETKGSFSPKLIIPTHSSSNTPTISPVINPFSSYGKREITSPVANPFNASDANENFVAKVLYTVNEYSKIIVDDALPQNCIRDSSPTQNAFTICPPDSPDSPLSRSRAGSPLQPDDIDEETFQRFTSIPTSISEETFNRHYYSGRVSNAFSTESFAIRPEFTQPHNSDKEIPTAVLETEKFIEIKDVDESLQQNEQAVESLPITHEAVNNGEEIKRVASNEIEDIDLVPSIDHDFDLDNVINDVSVNLGKNFSRNSFSVVSSPPAVVEANTEIRRANESPLSQDYTECHADIVGHAFEPLESEGSNMDNSKAVEAPSASSTVRRGSKIPLKVAPVSTPSSLSVNKLGLLLTDMQVRLKVPPSEELSAMVSTYSAAAADPKQLARGTNRLSSKNVDLHNEAFQNKGGVDSAPSSPSGAVEPTTELKAIKRGGRITKPTGEGRDSDTLSVSSAGSVKSRFSTSSKASKSASASVISAKTALTGPVTTKSPAKDGNSNSSVKSTTSKPKPTSPGSRYGGGQSPSAVPAVSRNSRTISSASFTSPAAAPPRTSSRLSAAASSSKPATSPTASSKLSTSSPAASVASAKKASEGSLKRTTSADALSRSASKSTIAISSKSTARSPDAVSKSPRSSSGGKSNLPSTADKHRRNMSDSTSSSSLQPATLTPPSTSKRQSYSGPLYSSNKPTSPLPAAVLPSTSPSNSIRNTVKKSPALNSLSVDAKYSANKDKKASSSSRLSQPSSDLPHARSADSTIASSTVPVRPKELTPVRAEKVPLAAEVGVGDPEIFLPEVTAARVDEKAIGISAAMTAEVLSPSPLPADKKKRVSTSTGSGYAIGTSNPMRSKTSVAAASSDSASVSSSSPMKQASKTQKNVSKEKEKEKEKDKRLERVDSKDSMNSTFLSIYSPATNANLLQLKRTKSPPVVRLTHSKETSLDLSAIGSEYIKDRSKSDESTTSSKPSSKQAALAPSSALPAPADPLAAVTNSSATAASASASLSLSSSPSSQSAAVVSALPFTLPPRPQPEAVQLLSPQPRKLPPQATVYMAPLTQASHAVITKMYQNMDNALVVDSSASSGILKGRSGLQEQSGSPVGNENESSGFNSDAARSIGYKSAEAALLNML